MPQTENRRRSRRSTSSPARPSPATRWWASTSSSISSPSSSRTSSASASRTRCWAARGVGAAATTFNSMIQQADTGTARVSVTEGAETAKDRLVAEVQVENLAGHKFPSGVGFRRAFLRFEVLDANGDDLWVSGRTTPRACWSTPMASRSPASSCGRASAGRDGGRADDSSRTIRRSPARTRRRSTRS